MPEKRWLRVLLVAFIMYTIAFIDRTNISMALPEMSRDLHMSPTEAGSAVGVFFWGYLMLQIPGGYLAEHWSAKRFISLLLVAWGMCSAGTALVTSGRAFWMMRLLLGVAEGGVWPAMLVLISHWFPSRERARANAYWMLCLPVAVVVSSPLSGWILGVWNWRVLLVVEGCFPLLWLVIWWRFIDDHPHQARWISADESGYLRETLAREAGLKPASQGFQAKVFLQPVVLVMILIYFLQNCGSYGFLFWLPSAIEHAGRIGSMKTGFLFTVPYAITAAGMVLFSRHSDKTGDRRCHVALALAWAGVFMMAAVLTSRVSPLLSFLLIALVGAGSYGTLGPFWAIPTESLPTDIAGSAMGLVNAIGNLGGFFGPLVVGYLNQRTGGFVVPFAVLSGAWLTASALAVLFLPRRKFPAVQPVATMH